MIEGISYKCRYICVFLLFPIFSFQNNRSMKSIAKKAINIILLTSE